MNKAVDIYWQIFASPN